MSDLQLVARQTSPPRRWYRISAIILLLAYFAVAILYAVNTPRWQVPDEPAHYNYVRALAEGEGFPVMEFGDYDQAYLSRLTSEGFPAELSVAAVEYEDHQPPLYYLLATPIYLISNGSLIALRLFSVFLGGVAVYVLLLMLREFVPDDPGFALLGSGIVMFIPQFVAMMAGVNNDALTVCFLWLWLWLALRYLRGQTAPWALGLILGAILLTKFTAYGVLPLGVLIVTLRFRREGQPFAWAFRQLLMLFLPALFLGALWWGRNVMVYGWPDVMGLQQHDIVVVGQPRTAQWIAQDGFFQFLTGAARTTFRSFWGQFGWMGVVLDTRIYQGLAIFSGLLLWGALWRLVYSVQQGLEPRQRDALILLGTSALITLAAFVGYNLTFVQHQGRYLFTALPFFALAAAAGLRRLAERRLGVLTSLILLFSIVILAGWGLLRGDIPKWPIAMVGLAMLTLAAIALASERLKSAMAGILLLGLWLLDIWCLFGFIVPILSG